MNRRTSVARVWLGGCTLAIFFTLAPWANAADGTASIQGVVTDAVAGHGLRKAYVRLAPAIGSSGQTHSAVTGDQGGFVIENVVPGEYRLEAECLGFLDIQYGGGPLFDSRATLRLSAGDKLTGIEIKMTPQAVLSGRVFDQDGDPWPHATVKVFYSVWKHGRRQIELDPVADFLNVNDRGEFRVAALAPGRYYVLAEPDATWEEEHKIEVQAQPAPRRQPTWYPSAADVGSAAPIALSAGEEERGIEIQLRRGADSKVRIRGKLAGMQEIPVPKGDPRFEQRRIFARRNSPILGLDQDLTGSIAPDGSFEIVRVPSGTYDVWVRQGYPVSVPLGHAVVQVNDRDIDDLSIPVRPPQILHVSVRVEGAGAKNLPRPSISLEAVDYPGWAEPYSIAKDDGSFEFQDVGSARYRVHVQDSFRGKVYLKSLRYENSESIDGTFVLDSYGVPLEVTLSTRGARLSGNVVREPNENPTGAGTPRVVLIPDTPDAARRENQTRAAVFDQNAVFAIEAIPPGSYKLYAFEDVPEDIWLAPEFLKEIEDSGVAFDAKDGDAGFIQAPLLTKKRTDQVLAKLGFQQ